MNNNKILFAFGKAVESKETTEIKRYIGIAPVQVLAVNPSKKDLESIYNTTLEKEPEYLGSTKVSFFVRKAFMTNRDNTKVKVVDKYARTAWVTQDEFKNKLVPQYKNGPARIDNNYRALYAGEEELLGFVKNYLGINDVDEFVDGNWRMRANPQDYEAGFNDMEKWFGGDISEIKNAIALMPNNYIKLLFGVRHTDDGREYQDVFNRATLKYSTRKNTSLEKALTEAKNNGAYANTDFEICDLKEFNPTPTNLEKPAVNDDDLPFGDDPWK